MIFPAVKHVLAGVILGFGLHQGVRLAMAGLFALFGVSLLLGRSSPPPSTRRVPGHPSFVYVNNYLLGVEGAGLRRFDAEIGLLESLPSPDGEVLECARGSPWRDSRGRWQVAGRSWTRSGPRRSPVAQGHCLALYEFPGGAVLGRVETEYLPTGAPCWEPGSSARVLFSAGDRALYWHDFEGPARSGANDSDGDSRPKPLSWACPQPGLGRVSMADPEWPSEPRLGRRLFVALQVLERVGGQLRYSSWQLWWLRLDRDRMTIVAAGPLLRPDPTIPASGAWGDHFPALLSGPGGELALAYLTFRPGVHLGQLRIALLRIDPATGEPSSAGGGPVLASDCVRTALAPSADGRQLCCVVQADSSGPRVLRVDLAETWGAGGSAGAS